MRVAKLKSQDIVVLLKLIALSQRERGAASLGADSTMPEWQGWSGARDAAALQAFEEGTDSPSGFSVRSLESSLGLSKSEISQSLRRSLESGLAIKGRTTGRPQPNAVALYELIANSLKYVFPPKLGQLARGIPTGVDAPVLSSLLSRAGEFVYVWRDPHGKAQGQSVEPLYRSVPQAVRRDPDLYAMLALVDAIRLGKARETAVASAELKRRMGLA